MAKDFVTPEQYQRGVGKIKNYVDTQHYYEYPTIYYDNKKYPKGYVNAVELKPDIIYKMPKYPEVELGSLGKISLCCKNDDGSLFMINNDGNTLGFSHMMNPMLYIIGKTDSFMLIRYKSYEHNYLISVSKNNGIWSISDFTSVTPYPGSKYEYTPTTDYSPATKKYVDDKVAGIVDSAPETLDTLQELATALGNDPNFATTVVTKIGKKVDKVEGMSLTHNDLTNELKTNYDAAYAYSQAKHSYNDLTDKPTIPSIDGLATEKYVDDKTSMENVIYEGNGTGPDVVSDYWTGCPVSKGNGCWVINKQIEFDSSKPNPYYLLCDTTLYSPENSTFDKTNSAWIYPKVPNTGTIFICNKYNGENKLVLPWDGVNTPGKIKLYTKTELAKAMFSGDYNDLSNKPNIPSIEGLATEEYVNNKVTDTATSLTNDPDIYLTKDKYQYVTGVNTVDNIIWLPSTDLPTFLKMHLYVTNCKMQSVFDAAIKWKINQNPNEGKFKIVTNNVYEFILTYINGSWIGEVVTYSNTEYTPTNDADVTTKKYVDNLTVQATSEEVKNMLNTTLGGDYSGEN